jgi:hypothetical protein
MYQKPFYDIDKYENIVLIIPILTVRYWAVNIQINFS